MGHECILYYTLLIMKRVKKATPNITKMVVRQFEIQCPHCYTFLRGGFNQSTIRFICSNCDNPIEIEWDKAKEVINF